MAINLVHLSAQVNDSVFNLTGIVYDDLLFPVPACHVIDMNTHRGTVTDSLGIFRLPVSSGDTLLILNIAYQDAVVPVNLISKQGHVLIKRQYYLLEEARIFEWGSTYGDFREAMIDMPDQQTLGESLGLPRQDPDYVPAEMNEQYVKSSLFLIKSPVSYFYYNFNRHARSARKVYWLKKNQEKIEIFKEIMSSDNISSITGLAGEELQDFLSFLFQKMNCDFKCGELQIYTEIYGLWDIYKKLAE